MLVSDVKPVGRFQLAFHIGFLSNNPGQQNPTTYSYKHNITVHLNNEYFCIGG